MARFMFLARGCCDAGNDLAPEEMQAAMQECMSWMQTGKNEGWLLDPGSPLSGGSAVVKSDYTVMDGPFAESKELVGGYSIIEAENIEAAVAICKSSPMPKMGATIEIREISQNGPKPE